MMAIGGLPRRWMAVGGGCLCFVALAACIVDPRAALTGWLAAAVFITAVPLGGLCLLLMMQIIPGRWRDELQPLMEAASLSQPITLVAFIPVLAGLPWIYEWATGEGLSAFQSIYLTPVFFDLRTLIALAAACILAVAITSTARGSKTLAIVGLIVFVIVQDMLAIDWLMSLDPHFHSSGFGLYVLAGQLLTAMATLTLFRLADGTSRAGTSLLASLLMVGLMVWAYLAFMQYFIIWSGNLTQGVVWFQRRGHGGWSDIEYVIAALHLAPFLFLLFPPVRASAAGVATLSMLILIGRGLEDAWLTLPALPSGTWIAIACDAIASIGLGLVALATPSLFRKRRATERGVP